MIAMLVLVPSSAASAQSVVDNVLKQAQSALDSTQDYTRAATLAQQVLAMTAATRDQQQTARVIIASAWYPLEAPNKRKHDDALRSLQDAVRADLDFRIKADLTWPALDSLLDEARRTGFSVKVSAAPSQDVAGNALAEVGVRANKPTSFRMTVLPAGGGAAIASDSTFTASGVLHLPVMANGRALLHSGTYDVRIVGYDAQKRDSIVVVETATVTAPDLVLQTIPTNDALKLLPERAGRTGLKGLKSALLVGGVIFVASSVLKADSLNAQKFSGDAKGLPVAAFAAGAVMLFSFRDPGGALPANVIANQQSRANLASEITRVMNENAGRVAAYRATIRMQVKP
jgi:hypothetical protein